MIRTAAFACLLLAAAFPAAARDGIVVWNDDRDLAVKLATLSPDDPAEATRLVTLVPLRTISVTMTAVASDGTAVGVCHELQDGNEGGFEMLGFDARGRQKWSFGYGGLKDAANAVLGPGTLDEAGGLLFLSCVNGGATGQPGVLAFDVGITRTTLGDEVILRLHLSGKTGKPVAAELRPKGATAMLPLGRNPFDRMERVEGGGVVYNPEAQFVFPEGGVGRLMWGSSPIRYQGSAVAIGHDFAWWLPPRP
jgi:hypothetical protein